MRATATLATDTGTLGALNIAVLIDNEVLRLGIEAALRTPPTGVHVHGCATRTEVEGLIRVGALDALIGTAADIDWLATLRQGASGTAPKVLVLIDETAIHHLTRHACATVDGFLSQQRMSAATIQDALHRCWRGELPMPPALARALLERAQPPAPAPRRASLTSREIEALTLMARGLSNKQIARSLAISSHGAKRLVGSVMLKLDSPNRTTAVVNAIRAGIVDPQ